MGLFGGIASAVGSVVGGLIGANSQKQANAAAYDQSMALNSLNYKQQKEFAQNGIRWKVQDAQAAGLHPLAALGANTATYTPSTSVGSIGPTDYSWLADAGQSIGRAVEAGLSRKERAAMQLQREEATQIDLDTRRAQLENQNLQNQALKLDMVRQMAADAERAVVHQQLGPGLSTRADGALIDGQTDATSSKLFTSKPAEIVANMPGRPGTEAGTITELGFTRTNDGGYVPVMSSDAKERYEDDVLGEIGFSLRNRLPALLDASNSAPPNAYLPDGGSNKWRWAFSISRGAWYPVRRNASLKEYLGVKF